MMFSRDMLLGVGYICFGIFIYFTGYSSGSIAVTNEWNEEKLATAKYIENLRQEYNSKLEVYITKTNSLITEIQEKDNEYQNIIDTLNASHANELQQSQQRIELYKRMSAKDNCESGSLSAHSAKLDQSLTEGRRVVSELKELIRLRDSQLRELGKQLDLLSEVQ